MTFEARKRCHQVLHLSWVWFLADTYERCLCLYVCVCPLTGLSEDSQGKDSLVTRSWISFPFIHSSLLCLPLILLFTSKVREISSYHLVLSVQTPLKRPTCMLCMFVFKASFAFFMIKEEPLYLETLKWTFFTVHKMTLKFRLEYLQPAANTWR